MVDYRKPPSQEELRRGEAAGWGPHPQKPKARLLKFTHFRNEAGTVLGFLSVELASGIIINDIKLMVGAKGRRWVALPAVKQTDRDGKPRVDVNGKAMWSPIVEFCDRATSDRFREMVLALLREKHPELFEDAP